MLFNSYGFGLFFLLFFAAYLVTLRHLRTQNVLLLVASYVFYGAWDWRFLGLIAASTLIDFMVGRRIQALPGDRVRARRRWLTVSIGTNLGLLGFFKYFGFFAESLSALLSDFGVTLGPLTLQIVLPVGISFYTFQTLSYTIDVYRGRLEATDSLLDFAVFVAFFPQLVAGPIERASHLLPQVTRRRRITPELVNSGLYLILWGYFLKLVIADNAAALVDPVFDAPSVYRGVDVWRAVLAFSLQIYGDFAGYSNIARGLAMMLGFDIMVNFRIPYAALSPSDFWRRWHVSLSTWLRDYLYVPLGGNRGGVRRTYRNLMLTMLLGGLWHGAAWNFVWWGAFHGGILVIYRVLAADERMSSFGRWGRVFAQWLPMFVLTQVGWLLFRADSTGDILTLLRNGVTPGPAPAALPLAELLFLGALLALAELPQHRSGDLLWLANRKPLLRAAGYAALLAGIVFLGHQGGPTFLYFQF